jgi:tryptophan synthase alpha chain
MKHRLMTHLVAHYPDGPRSLDVAAAMIDGGASYLEIQFPFSDPTADGPAIQGACIQALRQGFSVESGFELLKKVRDLSEIPLFIMCYGNTMFHRGVRAFVDRCAGEGVQGLIVPDLPVGYDEGLYDLCSQQGMDAIPVVAPTITPMRLKTILGIKPRYLYTALRKGITGESTRIGADNIGFLEEIHKSSVNHDLRILAGFGIHCREQIDLLAPHVHASIVGSAFIREIMDRKHGDVYRAVRDKVEELI